LLDSGEFLAKLLLIRFEFGNPLFFAYKVAVDMRSATAGLLIHTTGLVVHPVMVMLVMVGMTFAVMLTMVMMFLMLMTMFPMMVMFFKGMRFVAHTDSPPFV